MASDTPRHPFADDPQFLQQYGGGLGYGGNGLGRVKGTDPETWADGGDHYLRRDMRDRGWIHERESADTEEIADVLDRANLTPKQRFVIELRGGIRGGTPLTLQEIADLMGISNQAVSKIEKAAMLKVGKVVGIEA